MTERFIVVDGTELVDSDHGRRCAVAVTPHEARVLARILNEADVDRVRAEIEPDPSVQVNPS